MALFPFTMLLLLLCNLSYLLFELNDKTVFGFHVCFEGIKFVLGLEIDILKLLQSFLLLIELLLILLVLSHHVLEVILDCLKFILFLKQIRNQFPTVAFELIVLSFDIKDSLSPLIDFLLQLSNNLLCTSQFSLGLI